MARKNSTKRALIASALVLALCFTSFVGTTFAWFTDEVTSGNNIIKSGNLDIELEYAGMYSLAQLKNVEKNQVVTGCKVYSKNGLNINNGGNLKMSKCTFDVQGYTLRFGEGDGVYDRNYTITDSTLKSACAESGDAVFEFRAGAVKSTLTLTNTTVEGTVKVKGNTADTTIIGLN